MICVYFSCLTDELISWQAQGIGYVQELLSRLMNQTIPVSNSSVNSTMDSDPATFPLGQPFYLDM